MNSSSLIELDEYQVERISNGSLKVCYVKPPLLYNSGHGHWLDTSLISSLPTFALQLAILISINRIFVAISELYHIPRIVANIFAGFVIGPSALGSWDLFAKYVCPLKDVIPIETIGALTLVYYVFLVGLDMDLKPIQTCHNKKAIVVAISGIIFSFPFGIGLYYLLLTNLGTKTMPQIEEISHIRGGLIWAFTLSCSEFPEIAHTLSQLKLLLTENGQLALTASLFSDLLSCIFFVMSVSEFNQPHSLLSFACTMGFVVVCFVVIQPLGKWLYSKLTTGDREMIESQVVFMMHVVLVFGLMTDGLGASSVTGAFLVGAIMPKGVLNNAIQERVLDFVGTIMLPLFYMGVGERVKIQELTFSDVSWITVLIVILIANMAKMLSTLLVTLMYQMPLKDGFPVGALMNTKGPLSLIILTIARDRMQLDNQTYGVMLVACWAMTLPIGPVLASWKNTLATRTISQISKTLQGTRPDAPLRVLACVHTKLDANIIINLLKASCPSVKSPVQVVAMELVKMTAQRSREASCLIIKPSTTAGHRHKPTKSRSFKAENEEPHEILSSFDDLSQAIFAEKMRVVSVYSTMHVDICNVSKQRGVTLIITTLYKQPTYDGLGAGVATAKAANMVNKDLASKDEKRIVLDNLLKETPCCLAIFVDRDLAQRRSKFQKLAMIYVSGPDDREALSYSWRMSRNADHQVQLTVIRLVWNDINSEFDDTDDEYIRLFARQTQGIPWVRYLEKKVRDERETVSLLNKMAGKGFDLFLIGRGNGRKMSLAAEPVLEEPALGPLGDVLADLNSAAESSILVFQRHGDNYNNGGGGGGGRGESGTHSRCGSLDSQCVDGSYLRRTLSKRKGHSRTEAEAEMVWPTKKFIFSTGFM